MLIGATIFTLTLLGLLFGLSLAAGSRFLRIRTDPRLEVLINLLPGGNCGACNFPGCAECAAAMLEGRAPPTACPVAPPALHDRIAGVLGKKIAGEEKLTARVFCRGGNAAARSYRYEGVETCAAANQLCGGVVACPYGCLGYYTCRDVCPFDAIRVDEDGNPVVVEEKCPACGICVRACPRGVIKLVPASSPVDVFCSSTAPAGEVTPVCPTGCIGCGLCVKACPEGAIDLVDKLARIDYRKCVGCGKCIEVCPRGIIRMTAAGRPAEESQKHANSFQGDT